MKLRNYQRIAVDRIYKAFQKHDRVVLQVPTGGGKCFAKDTPILMFDGSIRAVQDVKVGDLLMGPDSKARRVLKLGSGSETMYKISPNKGEPFIVNESHILSLKLTNFKGQKRINDVYYSSSDICNISVKDYLQLTKSQRHLLKCWRTGIEFPEQEVEIDPYILGIWLADGHNRDTVITTADPEVIFYIKDYAQKTGQFVTEVEYKNNKSNGYRINNKGRPGFGLRGFLAQKNLYRNKHIPENFKINSREVRLELLAGILDGDGYLSNNSFDYISKDEKLAHDVLFLARSLGFAAYLKTCEKGIASTGFSGTYYRISISGDIDRIPNIIARRKAKPRKQKKDVLKTGFTIEALGEGEYFGFEIDGDRLFLLGDFTVTHNTVMASHILSNIGYNERAMFVVYGRQLVYQASKTLAVNGIEHGIIMADKPLDLSYDIQVASIDTLRSRYFSLEKAPPFDLVIVDETHEIGRYSAIFDHYKKILGLSATPSMSNGGGLGNYYDAIVYGPPIKYLVKNGWLCPVKCYAPIIPDFSKLRVSKQTNDYIESELDDFMAKDEIVGDMFDHWARLAYGKRTIVFASGVKHSKLSMQKFLEMGVPSAHVDGTTPQEEREEIFEAMLRGEILVLFNNRVFNRGMDFPPLECMIDAQPTLDMRLFIQKVGRIMRTYPGKEDAILLDMTGSLHRWGKPDEPIIWPIEAKEKAQFLKKKKPKKEIKESIEIPCPNCSYLFSPAKAKCPDCGYELKTSEAAIKIKQIEGSLGLFEGKKQEVKKVEPSMEQKRNVYRELIAYGLKVGYQPGWAKHKYKKIFGVWPRFPGHHLKSIRPANDVSPETLDWIQQDRQQFFKE